MACQRTGNQLELLGAITLQFGQDEHANITTELLNRNQLLLGEHSHPQSRVPRSDFDSHPTSVLHCCSLVLLVHTGTQVKKCYIHPSCGITHLLDKSPI